jgi:transcriptional regulator with XRE-family HTH domain
MNNMSNSINLPKTTVRKRRRSLKGLQSVENGENSFSIELGQRLRELRLKRGLTLRSLAELSDLNVNTLSMIENSRTSPSVSTLQQLASALNSPITAFFTNEKPKKNVVYYQWNQRPKLNFTSGVLEELGSGLAKRGAEPFLIHLQPSAESGSTPIVHTGLEFVFCLEGELTYNIDGNIYILSEGDSLIFEAHLPHHWQNSGSQVSRSLLVFCPSDENDQPIEKHLLPFSTE